MFSVDGDVVKTAARKNVAGWKGFDMITESRTNHFQDIAGRNASVDSTRIALAVGESQSLVSAVAADPQALNSDIDE